MPGVAQPTYPIVEPFGKDAGGSYIQLPIPVPSQIGITNGEASFTDGFPPLCFTDPTAGGIPPRGKDFNGLLYMITQYCVMLQAGQVATYNSDVSTAISGYGKGALLGASDGSGFWYNTVDGNTNDPDSNSTGWIKFTPSGTNYLSTTIPSGSSNNYNAGGNFTISVGVLDIDPQAGNATITGLAAGYDGQRVIITNINASNSLILAALNGGSSAANQLRLPADITLLQYGSLTLQYSTGAGKWLASL